MTRTKCISETLDEVLREEIEKAFSDAIEIRDFRSAFATRKALVALYAGKPDEAEEAFLDWEAEPDLRAASKERALA